jgi:hypothetical protein
MSRSNKRGDRGGELGNGQLAQNKNDGLGKDVLTSGPSHVEAPRA